MSERTPTDVLVKRAREQGDWRNPKVNIRIDHAYLLTALADRLDEQRESILALEAVARSRSDYAEKLAALEPVGELLAVMERHERPYLELWREHDVGWFTSLSLETTIEQDYVYDTPEAALAALAEASA